MDTEHRTLPTADPAVEPESLVGEDSAYALEPVEPRFSPLAALAAGLRLALRYWPALLLMLLGTLLAAALLALLPALNLMDLANRPVIAEIANGLDSWQIVDLLGAFNSAQRTGAQPPASLGSGTSALLLGILALPLVGGVISAFLYGGVILTYREAPAPFRLGRFLWGCWHWFGAFLLMALVEAVLFLLFIIPVALLATTVLSGAGQVGSWIIAAIVLLALLLWLMLFELARVRTVLANRQNPFAGIAQAFPLLFRRLLPLLAFYLIALLLLALVHAVFRLGILPITPVAVLPLALLAQQAFILARLFLCAVRLAGLAQLNYK